jgi:hypothetical protein
MSIPQFLGSTPFLGGIFVALLHVAAGWMLYRLAVEARGRRAGLFALVLFAFAPWDVLYGDRIWLSCVAPVWGTALFYFAHRAKESAAAQGAFVFFALVCPQLHMSAPIVWIAAAVLLFFARPARISRRAVAIGTALAVVAYAPAIYWELTHGFGNTVAILEKSGGNVEPGELWKSPFRVLGSAILFGSSEIGYHFARGYWTAFDEGKYYVPARYFAEHGLWAVANIFSVVFSLAAWIAAVRAIERPRSSLEHRLVLALLAALAAAALLILVARKAYFPHYANLLMPLALAPVAFAADRMFARRWWRPVAAALIAVTVVAMAASSIRYYLRVDRLNGLAATTAMVARVLSEPGPFRVDFEGFHNKFAWELLANGIHGRALPADGRAPVHFRVKNGAPFQGELPKGAERFGAVVLIRTPAEGP